MSGIPETRTVHFDDLYFVPVCQTAALLAVSKLTPIISQVRVPRFNDYLHIYV